MHLDEKRFLALQQPGVQCDLHLVHSMIFDEIEINRGVISVLEKGCPHKHENPYVQFEIQKRIQELTWANEGLRSLMEKVFQRIDEHHNSPEANSSGEESSKVHRCTKGKVSVEQMLAAETGQQREENPPQVEQDGREKSREDRKNQRSVLGVVN